MIKLFGAKNPDFYLLIRKVSIRFCR